MPDDPFGTYDDEELRRRQQPPPPPPPAGTLAAPVQTQTASDPLAGIGTTTSYTDAFGGRLPHRQPQPDPFTPAPAASPTMPGPVAAAPASDPFEERATAARARVAAESARPVFFGTNRWDAQHEKDIQDLKLAEQEISERGQRGLVQSQIGKNVAEAGLYGQHGGYYAAGGAAQGRGVGRSIEVKGDDGQTHTYVSEFDPLTHETVFRDKGLTGVDPTKAAGFQAAGEREKAHDTSQEGIARGKEASAERIADKPARHAPGQPGARPMSEATRLQLIRQIRADYFQNSETGEYPTDDEVEAIANESYHTSIRHGGGGGATVESPGAPGAGGAPAMAPAHGGPPQRGGPTGISEQEAKAKGYKIQVSNKGNRRAMTPTGPVPIR